MGKNPKGKECGTVTGIGKQDRRKEMSYYARFSVCQPFYHTVRVW